MGTGVVGCTSLEYAFGTLYSSRKSVTSAKALIEAVLNSSLTQFRLPPPNKIAFDKWKLFGMWMSWEAAWKKTDLSLFTVYIFSIGIGSVSSGPCSSCTAVWQKLWSNLSSLWWNMDRRISAIYCKPNGCQCCNNAKCCFHIIDCSGNILTIIKNKYSVSLWILIGLQINIRY